jgi:hypothetical protein
MIGMPTLKALLYLTRAHCYTPRLETDGAILEQATADDTGDSLALGIGGLEAGVEPVRITAPERSTPTGSPDVGEPVGPKSALCTVLARTPDTHQSQN